MTTPTEQDGTADEVFVPRARTGFPGTKSYLSAAAAATVMAAPIGLIAAGETVLVVIGMVYASVWTLVVLPSMAVSIFFIYDALLMLTGRWPVFLPDVLVSYQLRDPAHQRRAIRIVHNIAQFSAMANPLTNLALASMVAVARIRTDLFIRVYGHARARSAQGADVSCGEPIAEYASPVISKLHLSGRFPAAAT